jgi:Uncharacterized conserved protein
VTEFAPVRLGFAFGLGTATFFAPCAFPLLLGYVGLYLGRDGERRTTVRRRLLRGVVVGGVTSAGFFLVCTVLAGLALTIGTRVLQDIEAALAETTAEDDARKMSIIAIKGTLDMAYPPLILASTAAAFGYEVTVFHTFWGLDILHEERSTDLKLSSIGNPNMPVPNAVAALPGMDRVTTRMM